MVTLEVVVDGKVFLDAEAAFDHVTNRLQGEVKDGMVRASKELLLTLKKVATEIGRKHSNPWNGQVVNNSPRLQKRSGAGLQSIAESVKLLKANGDLIEGQITTGAMSIHETGGVVTPKKAKFLTIPLPAAMDSRGVPLRRAARDWEDTFVARSKRGALLIFQRRGDRVVPLYVLKQSVKIPARLKMDAEFEAQLPFFEQRAFEALARALGI